MPQNEEIHGNLTYWSLWAVDESLNCEKLWRSSEIRN